MCKDGAIDAIDSTNSECSPEHVATGLFDVRLEVVQPIGGACGVKIGRPKAWTLASDENDRTEISYFGRPHTVTPCGPRAVAGADH